MTGADIVAHKRFQAKWTPVRRPKMRQGKELKTPTAQRPPHQSCVGPNAVIQLGAALRERLGEDAARQIFAEAGLLAMLTEPPGEMVDERSVARLYRALFASVEDGLARAIAVDAGVRTANYILAHRIPRAAQLVLRILPASLAAPMLIRAISSNAWTFAGSGVFRARTGSPLIFEIAQNPISMPDCVWHRAVFERLFHALVTPNVSVNHPQCCHAGASICRFEIALGGMRQSWLAAGKAI